MPPHKRNRFRRHRSSGPKPSAVETPPSRPVDSTGGVGAPPSEPDIPELKKKEKERKGGAGLGYSGASGGNPGIALNMGAGGARVGSSLISQPGFLGTGKIAALLSNAFGGPATFLGGMFAGKLGAFVVLGGLVAWGGVMTAAGLKLSGIKLGFGTGSTETTQAYVPGAVSDAGIIIDKPKAGSLGYLANANQGEILWDKEHPMAPKDDDEDIIDAPEGDAMRTPQFEIPDVSALTEEVKKKVGLDREGFVKKLSKGTGGGVARGARLKNGTAGFNLKSGGLTTKTFTPRGTKTGRSSALARARSKLGVRKLSTDNGKSNRAAGQLKLARNMSATGAAAAPDSTARAFATDAFDQGRTIGGELSGVMEGTGIVVPPGNGAPGAGVTNNGVEPLAPPPNVGPGENVTPYQGNLDRARNLDNQAGQNKMMGMMMLALGAVLIAIGMSLLGTVPPIGAALIGMGAALVGMGMMMLMMSQQQGQQAQGQGQEIREDYGQEDQGGVIDDCADQAVGSGTKAADCNPSTTTADFNQQINANNVQQAVEVEYNQTYTWEGEGENANASGGDTTYQTD